MFVKAFMILSLLAALPSTSTYKLNSFGFGAGGTANSTTTNYGLEGTAGELGGLDSSTSAYKVQPGFVNTQQANVPPAPTLTNPSNYYDKLHLVLNNGGNPTDALFAISISTDGFTSTNYVKQDHTVGSTLVLADYQTYSSWSGATGFDIIGLTANTTYSVKIKATQGKYTESAYGPTTSGVATVGQQFTFSITPNAEALGSLTPDTVISSPSNVTANIDTNANNGGNVYISGVNGGLRSLLASTTITSNTTDLSVATTGFGVRGLSATQTGGGPLSIVSPYNGALDNVGLTDTSLRTLFTTSGPISAGVATFVIKAKVTGITPAATDYNEKLTAVGAATF